MESRAPRIGHKKSRLGCAQCKRRHVKCNEEKPCSNCIRLGVACSLAGGPNVQREDTRPRAGSSTVVSSSVSSSKSPQPDSSVRLGPEYRGSSPLRHLTLALDRGGGGGGLVEQKWMTDLELMHHFDTHTLAILTEASIARCWPTDLPKLVFVTPYLMHVVLGVSALHMAHTSTQRSRALAVAAVSHLDQALQLFRQESPGPSAENADARFCFSWFVVLFAYAIPSSVNPVDAICEVFRLVQGIDATVQESFAWLAAGPFASLLNHSLLETMQLNPDNGVIVPRDMAFGLDHLDYMMALPSITPEDSATCVLVLSELKQLYSNVVSASTSTGIALVMCWPKSDAAPFIELLRQRNPQALVILAYYCVILDLLNERWFLQGWSTRIMQQIIANLDEEWKHWIAWPAQSIMLKHNQSASSSSAAASIF